MELNPFFLQGSQSEQRLVQDLINEQLQIYGVEVTYIPRKFVRKQTIIKEVQSSAFDDNFLLQACVNTYEGYGGQVDIMTKFGVSLRDELTLTISKERFEDFISPFLESDEDYELSTRPREGDIIFFPLGARLFEVKFVEHEEPFYQLGKNYVYQLKCELFEYEDEVIDTGIDIIDSQLEDIGYITTLQLIGTGVTATANAQINPENRGYIREIVLNDDGSGYSSTPNVAISTAPFGAGNVDATAVAITTTRAGIFSIDRILLTNAGAGYTTPPSVTITGGGGVGAAATAAVELSNFGIVDFTLSNNGIGYASKPTVTITGVSSSPASAEVNLLADNTISDIFLKNAGIGYTVTPTVTISNPSLISGVGNDLKKWNFIPTSQSSIKDVFDSFNTNIELDKNFSTPYVFIVDRDLSLRGRDDDEDTGMLYGFNSQSVAEINNKMVDDVKIILAEYRLALKKNDSLFNE